MVSGQVLADEAGHFEPKLRGSIGDGPNHSNYSDQSSVRILGIRRKPEFLESVENHENQNSEKATNDPLSGQNSVRMKEILLEFIRNSESFNIKFF